VLSHCRSRGSHTALPCSGNWCSYSRDVPECPSRVITPPPAPDGPIDCANNCHTKDGNPTHGCVGCISAMCKHCCMDDYHNAIASNRACDLCKAHKLDLIRDTPPAVPLPPPTTAAPGASQTIAPAVPPSLTLVKTVNTVNALVACPTLSQGSGPTSLSASRSNLEHLQPGPLVIRRNPLA